MNIRQQLQKAIQDCEETQYAISKATEIDQPRLSRFVSEDDNHRDLSLEAVVTLCEYLGLELIEKKGRSRK